MNNRLVLGIDVGGTNFRIGLVEQNGKLYNFTIESSSILTQSDNPLQSFKKYIKNYLQTYLNGKLIAISVGFPATVSKDKNKIYSAPNLTGFNNINISEHLEEEFQVPVFLDRDVNYLLMYDIIVHNIPQKGVTVGFYIGTGFGNAIYINGEFLSGKNGVAGELGHIPVLHSKELCGCGNVGCIEIYASGKALYRIWELNFKDTEIDEIFMKYKDSPVLKDFIDAISIPIATEINILDPDNIIIGGGVVNMKGFPIDYFEECIFQHVRKPYPALNLKYIYSLNNKEAGVMGAAYYAFARIQKNLNTIEIYK